MGGFNLREANKLLRFVHPLKAGNNGILESWNDGFKEINIQIGYDFIGVHVLIEYVSGKTEIDAMQASSKVDSTFFVKWSFFRFSCPAFQNSTIPSFHWAYQENGRKKYRDSNEL